MKRTGIQVVMRSDSEGYFAYGSFDGEGITVFAGSRVSRTLREAIREDAAAAAELGLDRIGRLTADRYFESPSEASLFISGDAAGCWERWVAGDGRKLSEIRGGLPEGTVGKEGREDPLLPPVKTAADSREKSKKIRQIKDSVESDLIEMAQAFPDIRIAQRHVNTGIYLRDTAVAYIYYRLDSVSFEIPNRVLLQDVKNRLDGESIAYRSESGSGRGAAGRESLSVAVGDVPLLLKALIGEAENGDGVRSPAGTEALKRKAPDRHSLCAPAESLADGTEAERPVKDCGGQLPPSPEAVPETAEAGDTGPIRAESSGSPKESEPLEAKPKPPEGHSSDRPAFSGLHRMLLCADVRLGAECVERLNPEQSHKWQTARNESFADMIGQAARFGNAPVALFGRIFGQERVPESVIDMLFQIVGGNPAVSVVAFLNGHEYERISYRSEIPGNLHLLHAQGQDSYRDDSISVSVGGDAVTLLAGNGEAVTVTQDHAGKYLLSGVPGAGGVPSFEPVGFEDAQSAQFGLGILKWEKDRPAAYEIVSRPGFAFKALELKIMPVDDPKEFRQKISEAARPIRYDTFLRVTVTGRCAFGLTLSGDGLKSLLQNRIFFAEVYDNTVMDIDEEAFETDISLRSEFVRLALQDETLSESERSRIISYGWKALGGGEVSAE